MKKQSTNVYKLGIDVATNKTGVGLFHNDKPIWAGLIISKEDGGFFRGDKVSQDAINIQNEMGKLVLAINERLIKDFVIIGSDEKQQLKREQALQETKIIIAIEVSNHANKGLAQKLGVYAGMYASILSVQLAQIGFSFLRDNLEIKFVNPNEWKLRTYGVKVDRELGKIAAINYVNEKFYGGKKQLSEEKIKQGHDDIADALCIASVAHALRDNFVVGQARHTRQNTKEKNKAKISTLTTKLTKLRGEIQDKRAKFLDGIRTAKNSKFDLQKEQERDLIDFATTSQRERYFKYVAELEKLEADIEVINKFKIQGVQ